MVFHINPEDVGSITLLYGLTNVFLAAALIIYIFRAFRRWNIVQMLLDTAVLSYLVLDLTWIAFLDEDFRNILLLQSDWISTSCIVLDVLVAMWIVILFISVRSGKLPIHIQLIISGALLYSVTDLIYYYQYFFRSYEPNSILDAFSLLSFCLFAAAARLKLEGKHRNEDKTELLNIGRSRRGAVILAAPVIENGV